MAVTALVVDNNPVLLKAVSFILSQEGCEVSVAKNGLEALEILKKDTPDILFTDLIMPLVDGEQLCKIVRGVDEYKKIFLVVLSAVILEDKERIMSEIDCDVYIAKGTLSEIKRHLCKTLDTYNNSSNVSSKILGGSDKKDKTIPSTVMKELLHTKEHLLRMLENLSEGIIELSHNGKIVSINEAGLSIWQYNREEIISKRFKDFPLGNHAELIKKWCYEQLEGQAGQPLEIHESDPLLIENSVLTASFLPIMHDNVYFAICILRDITRQHFAEKKKEETDNAIKLAKKMDAMSSMAGGVAHDFNNLLTVICGNLDMIDIKNSSKGSVKNKKFLKNARLSAYTAVELVRKISNFSPFGIIHRQDFSLEDFVKISAENFFEKYNHTNYKIDTLKQGNFVNIDPSQMRTALFNVLQNSVEHGEDKNILITIEQELIKKPIIRSGQYLPAGDYGKVIVTDLGMGLKSQNIHEIFNPYFSTKERGSIKGMGLGLTIVYSTLRNHGGHVVVESEIGKGTSVSLFLPLNAMPDQMRGLEQKAKVILFFESDVELSAIGRTMMEFLDYKVIDVKNRNEALQILKTDREEEQHISVAIINLSENGHSDSVDTCTLLHEIYPDLNVVVSSGAIFDPVMRDFKEFGFDSTLAKPYTMDDLKKVLSGL